LESGVAVSTGIMNMFSATVGGVSMCHGAGGIAGYIAFGVRTVGSVVIFCGLLVLAIFLSGSIEMLFKLCKRQIKHTAASRRSNCEGHFPVVVAFA
jgi:hypothetical protein